MHGIRRFFAILSEQGPPSSVGAALYTDGPSEKSMERQVFSSLSRSGRLCSSRGAAGSWGMVSPRCFRGAG